MFTVYIQEYKTSSIETRHDVPSQHAHNLGSKGGFYKVQLVNSETDVIEFEYKEGLQEISPNTPDNSLVGTTWNSVQGKATITTHQTQGDQSRALIVYKDADQIVKTELINTNDLEKIQQRDHNELNPFIVLSGEMYSVKVTEIHHINSERKDIQNLVIRIGWSNVNGKMTPCVSTEYNNVQSVPNGVSGDYYDRTTWKVLHDNNRNIRDRIVPDDVDGVSKEDRKWLIERLNFHVEKVI